MPRAAVSELCSVRCDLGAVAVQRPAVERQVMMMMMVAVAVLLVLNDDDASGVVAMVVACVSGMVHALRRLVGLIVCVGGFAHCYLLTTGLLFSLVTALPRTMIGGSSGARCVLSECHHQNLSRSVVCGVSCVMSSRNCVAYEVEIGI